VSQINGAINQVGLVTQRNAAGAEQLSSTAEELASQAEALQEMISFFRVNTLGDHPTGRNRKIEKTHVPDHEDRAKHGSSSHASKSNGDYAESFARI
jgi:hypothetical protein